MQINFKGAMSVLPPKVAQVCFRDASLLFSFTAAESTTHIEYVTISQDDGGENPPINTASATVSDDGTVFVEGPLDMPGATVEIVETDHQPVLTSKGRNKSRVEAPAYREQLLLRCGIIYSLLHLRLMCW